MRYNNCCHCYLLMDKSEEIDIIKKILPTLQTYPDTDFIFTRLTGTSNITYKVMVDG